MTEAKKALAIVQDPHIKTRWLLKDGFTPAGIIVFDLTVSDQQVTVFQYSDDPKLSQAFDSYQESAQFEADELADALMEIAEKIKGAKR